MVTSSQSMKETTGSKSKKSFYRIKDYEDVFLKWNLISVPWKDMLDGKSNPKKMRISRAILTFQVLGFLRHLVFSIFPAESYPCRILGNFLGPLKGGMTGIAVTIASATILGLTMRKTILINEQKNHLQFMTDLIHFYDYDSGSRESMSQLNLGRKYFGIFERKINMAYFVSIVASNSLFHLSWITALGISLFAISFAETYYDQLLIVLWFPHEITIFCIYCFEWFLVSGLMYVSNLYLQLRYNEIDDKILHFLHSSSRKQQEQKRKFMWNLWKRHQGLTMDVIDYNRCFKVFVATIMNVLVPCNVALVYTAWNNDLNFFLTFTFNLISVQTNICALFISSRAATIAVKSHREYGLLNSLQARSTLLGFTTREMLMLRKMIEDVGFPHRPVSMTTLDGEAFTYEEVYEYIVQTLSLYTLYTDFAQGSL